MNYPWPKVMFVSNNFSKAQAERAYIHLSDERDSTRSSGKRKTMRNTKNDLKILNEHGNMKRKTFRKVKASNPKHIREQNRKAQNNLREAIESSILNQTEIPQGQDSV